MNTMPGDGAPASTKNDTTSLTPNPSNPTQTEDAGMTSIRVTHANRADDYLSAVGAYFRMEPDGRLMVFSGHRAGLGTYARGDWRTVTLERHPKGLPAMLSAAPTISPRGSDREHIARLIQEAWDLRLDHIDNSYRAADVLASLSPRGRGSDADVIADAADALRSLSCDLMNQGKPSERYYNLAVALEALAAPRGRGEGLDREQVQEAIRAALAAHVFAPTDVGILAAYEVAAKIAGPVLAALSSAPVSGGWQDIASAPGQTPVIVGHQDYLGWFRIAIRNACGEWSYDDRPWLQQDPLDRLPTHWRALPPPPATGEVGT